MPASEFVRWWAFYQIEPFGTVRDNFHIAMLCALIANVHRDPKKPPLTHEDFMLTDKAEREQQKVRRLMAKFRGMASKNGD